ncbi:MAG: Tim44 domain-containing protein [Telluria sp.]
MKKAFAVLLLAAAVAGALADAAEARPLGGGRSLGRQSQNVARRAPPAVPAQPARAPNNVQNPAPAVPPAMAPKPASPWRGILGGLLVGAGLGALFSHFGMGGSVLGVLLVVLAVSLVLRMFRRRAIPVIPPAPLPVPAAAPQPDGATWALPAGFDREGFLRDARAAFVRMQSAWDKGDLDDLREFTTPMILDELRGQIAGRTQADYTEVAQLDAQLLGIEDLGAEWMASVHFTGASRPAPGAEPQPLDEVWNFTRLKAGPSGWLLAGIQQRS